MSPLRGLYNYISVCRLTGMDVSSQTIKVEVPGKLRRAFKKIVYFCLSIRNGYKMKKGIVIIFFLITSQLFAQHKPVQFGFRIAPNAGWFGSEQRNYDSDGLTPGASWGFVSEIYIMEGYSFNTGFNVVFLNTAMKLPWTENDSAGTRYNGTLFRKLKTKYVEIPLVFTMKTKEIKNKYRIYGQIGFGLGLLLNAKADDRFVSDNGQYTGEVTNTPADDFVRFTREALILGVGAEFPLTGSTYLRTGFKYDNAFVNVLKGENTAGASLANKGTNHFLELNISVIF